MQDSTLSFLASQPSKPVFLRLFEDGPQVAAHSPLRDCFEAYVLPELDERARSTIDGYFDLLSLWEQLTDNPAAGMITRDTLKAFRTKLVETPFKRGKKKHKRSPATVNKHLRTLAALLSPLWPADRHNPGGKGFVPFCKFPEPLARQKKLVQTFSLAQMSSLYQAADACRCPKLTILSTVHNPIVWQTAMVVALNTGPRTWDLVDLRWPDVLWNDFRYGSIFYRARKTSKDQRLPLNQVARTHLEYLHSLALDPEYVFGRIPAKSDSWYNAWKRICERAGMAPVPFERFRKTCSTLHNNLVPGAGEFLTGHSLRGVNAQYYDNPTRRVRDAVYRFKNPAAFRRGARSLRPHLPKAG